MCIRDRACGVCARSCPGQALKLEGERRTADSIVEECLQDLDFYEESSGGVTLSGGEPLLQPEFSAALLKALKSKGIHTAMETTGCVPVSYTHLEYHARYSPLTTLSTTVTFLLCQNASLVSK